jgi:hypothetical protein
MIRPCRPCFARRSPRCPPIRPSAASKVAPAPLTTDELYVNLLKLDELHKKGILTDEEFAAKKKKLLARSK